jgi:hypothetical protein
VWGRARGGIADQFRLDGQGILTGLFGLGGPTGGVVERAQVGVAGGQLASIFGLLRMLAQQLREDPAGALVMLDRLGAGADFIGDPGHVTVSPALFGPQPGVRRP